MGSLFYSRTYPYILSRGVYNLSKIRVSEIKKIDTIKISTQSYKKSAL